MTARERFEATRRAVPRLNDVKLLLMHDGDDWRPEGVRASHEVGDPTANRAIYNVDELEDKLESLRAEERELESLIGESLVIIRGVREGLGDRYADLLEARYIDCWEWERIREEYDVKRPNGNYMLGIAFDWVDSVGVSKLLRGEIEL